MKLSKLMTMTALVLVNVSAQAEVLQWSSVDNLVSASESIKTTFNAGIRRTAGVGVYAQVGGIAGDGLMTPVHMSYAQKDAYNSAIGEVQNDIFQKTAEEYLAEQSELAQGNFNAAVDAFVDAASVFVQATYVNALSAQVQASGDAVEGQALQAYVTDNNVLITTANVDIYNEALDTVELAAETWATVEAVYQDPQRVAGLQQMADNNGVDFLNANDLFLDRFELGNQNAIVEFTHDPNMTLWLATAVDTNLKTVSEIIDAGATDAFYTQGPTQNEEVMCAYLGISANQSDPDLPCYVENTGAP